MNRLEGCGVDKRRGCEGMHEGWCEEIALGLWYLMKWCHLRGDLKFVGWGSEVRGGVG
ncbi:MULTISPECIES: hypothetical protein [Bartonella]|uniref:hypothetical protein n=1 Tax=Bartonella TaxID=773 RepID=UPI002360DAF5|nr:hypothetical protein [Bartonella grahamii]